MSSASPLSYQDALAIALRILSRRDHSESELQRKLLQAGVPEDYLAPLGEQCRAQGWLDERRFAEMLIRSRVRKGYGPRYIEAELQQHRLEGADIAQWLADAQVDWLQACRRALAKKGDRRVRDATAQRKLAGYLYRRGFDSAQIRAVLDPEH